MVKRYYRFLIKLPSTKLLVALYVSLLVFFLITNYVYSIIMIIQTIVYVTYALFSKTLINLKRSIALSISTVLYSFLIDSTLGFGIGLASSIALQITILVGLDGVSLTSYFIPTIPYFSTIALTQHLYISLIVLGILSTMYAIALDFLIYKYISRYGINGYSSVEIGRLFLRNRLADDKSIENIFENISKPSIIKPCLFISDKVVLIHTDLHYGPFYDTGSSSLPKLLYEEERKKGYHAIVLHGAGSHERDLPRSSLSRLITDKILSNLDKIDEGYREKLHGFFHLKGRDNWEAIGIVFEKTTIILLSRPYSGIDDIPYHIQRLIDEESVRMNLGRIIVIDSHNWELSREPDYEALKELISNSIESILRVRSEEPAEPLIRYACVDADFEGLIDKEICGLEVVKKNSDGKLILIYLRGNNMVAGLRNRIIDLVKRFYSDRVLVEVVSNDEHSETGIYALYVYRPINCEYGLEEVINKLMNELSMKKYFEEWRTICFEDNILLLDNGAYKLLNVLEKTFPRASTLILLLVITTPLFNKFIQILLGI